MIFKHTWIVLLILGCGGVESEPDASEDGEDDAHEVLAEPGDAAHEEGGCSGLTGGPCNVVEQCGCTDPEVCQVLIDTETCEAAEQCLPLTDDLEPGAECARSDQCRAGSSCLSMGMPTRRCYVWCRTDADCPGTECSLEVRWNSPSDSPTCPGMTITPPYMACALP